MSGAIIEPAPPAGSGRGAASAPFRVDVVTIFPEYLAPLGQSLLGKAAERGPLTVVDRRWHSGTLLLQLAGPSGDVYDARETVDALRNTVLLVPVADLPEIEDPDSFYDHQLVGLQVRLPDDTVLGEVTAVRHEAQDLLVVHRPDAPDVLVPFVSAIVPTVEPAGGFLVVDPPEGLLDL